jgi:hypothetical protein
MVSNVSKNVIYVCDRVPRTLLIRDRPSRTVLKYVANFEVLVAQTERFAKTLCT